MVGHARGRKRRKSEKERAQPNKRRAKSEAIHADQREQDVECTSAGIVPIPSEVRSPPQSSARPRPGLYGASEPLHADLPSGQPKRFSDRARISPRVPTTPNRWQIRTRLSRGASRPSKLGKPLDSQNRDLLITGRSRATRRDANSRAAPGTTSSGLQRERLDGSIGLPVKPKPWPRLTFPDVDYAPRPSGRWGSDCYCYTSARG